MEKIIFGTLQTAFGLQKTDLSSETLKKFEVYSNSSDKIYLLIQKNEDFDDGIEVTLEPTKKHLRNIDTSIFVKFKKDQSGETAGTVEESEKEDEAQTVQRLQDTIIKSDNSQSSIMTILSEMRKFSKNDSIMSSLAEARQSLLEKVTIWSEDAMIIENRSKLNLIEQISAIKARAEKIKAVIKVCDSLFRDLEKYQESRKNLAQVAREIEEEGSLLFRRWCSSWSSIEFDTKKPCIITDEETQVPEVTFEPRLVALFSECRTLRCLGYEIPEEISSREEDLAKYSTIARELKEIVNFYCTIGDQILICHRPMLIDSAKTFTQLLKSKEGVTWDLNHGQLVDWLSQVKSYAQKFDHENRNLRKWHAKILRLVSPLFDVPFDKWKPILTEVATIFYDIDSKYSNTKPWKKHWDHQLYKILEYHFLKAINECDKWLGFFPYPFFQDFQTSSSSSDSSVLRVDLCFTARKLCYVPSIEDIQSRLYNRINRFLSIPKEFTGFTPSSSRKSDDLSSKNLFASIYTRNSKHIYLLYDQAKEILDELHDVQSSFVEWVSLYHIVHDYGHDPEGLTKLLGLQTLDDYRENLILIKSKAQEFVRRYMENDLKCEKSNIVINLIPVKVFVSWLYDEVDRLLVHLLKSNTEKTAKEFDDHLTEILLKLSKPPDKMSTLIEIEKIWSQEIPSVRKKTSQVFEKIEDQYNFLMKWSSKSVNNQHLSALSEKYDQLTTLIRNRESILESFRQMLGSKIRSHLQDFVDEVSLINRQWTSNKIKSASDPEFIKQMKSQTDLLQEDVQDLILGCEYFKIDMPDNLKEFRNIQREVVDAYSKFTVLSELEEGLASYLEMEWIIARHKLNSVENYLKNWTNDHPDCDDPIIVSRLSEWKDFVHVLRICRGEYFAKPHWQQFISLIELDDKKEPLDMEKLRFSHLVKQREVIIAKKDAIKQLNDQAYREQSVRDTFDELENFMSQSVFDLYDYQGVKVTLKLIKNWRPIMNQISESLLTLSTLKGSDFFTNNFADITNQWESRLTSLDMAVNRLNLVQRKWIYLEPIFLRDDGSNIFKDTGFTSASNDFISIMKAIEYDAHVFRAPRIPGILNRLDTIHSVLVACQKKLTIFMEESRNRFPRFYFLADDELLRVLAGKSSIKEASLMRKIFNNTINKIHFKNDCVEQIESVEGEMVKLRRSIPISFENGPKGMEKWLKELEDEIRKTLKTDLFDWLKQSRHQSEKLVMSAPSQIINLIQWIKLTSECEDAIRRGRLKNVREDLAEQMASLIQEDGRMDDKIAKIKIRSMIMDMIHFISMIEYLISENVSDIDDWRWQKQLRYYSDISGEKVQVCMGLATIEYTFDYIGCIGSSKLVQTPLTDQCFLVCMEALASGMGGNPYGPAGTGKTETIKALGQRLGRQVMVFNCDEALDVKSMTRILIGIIKCGFWGCFDEFNRLQVEVLSSLSSLIHAIQNSLKTSSDKAYLPGIGEIQINTYSGIFVTLNPAGKQYKGRQNLPDNLKALFLPVAMTVPDSHLISRVLLLSEGFSLNMTDQLGHKITSCFRIANDCMSKQKHYDWSLRAIKSTIQSAGKMLRETTENIEDETQIIIQALRRQIKPKMVEQDQKRLEDLLKDIFGSQSVQQALLKPLFASSDHEIVVQIVKESKLILNDHQISQVFELQEQLSSRLGVIILGDSGTGKTTLWTLLAKFIGKKNSKTINVTNINSKAMSRANLLGFIDSDTREWHDGVLTRVARSIARDEDEDQNHWIVFDGDIDPEWIEALNSVLDDNRVLTLPSGERIDFDINRVSLIFTTTSLQFASPATISRVGVISLGKPLVIEYLESGLEKIGAQDIKPLALDSVQRSTWPLSQAQTLLSLLKYSKINDNPYQNVISLINEDSNSAYIEPQLEGDYVITSSNARIVRLVEVLNQCSHAHLLILGPQGVGKSSMIEETIISRSNSTIVRLFCGPDTQPETLIELLKSYGHMSGSGMGSKNLSARNGGKIIIFVRNLELLKSDQWCSVPLIAFLTSLIDQNGFYEPSSAEWIYVEGFQVIATGASGINTMDPRLVCRMNLVKMPKIPIEDLKTIIQLRCPSGSSWSTNLASGVKRMLDELPSGLESHAILFRAMNAIQNIKRYSEVNNQVLWKECYRAFQSCDSEEQRLRKILDFIFSSRDAWNTQLSLPIAGQQANLKVVDREEATKRMNSCLDDWIDQSEVKMNHRIGLIPETIQLLGEVACFLSDTSAGIKGLLLLGDSASGRKLACKVMASHFNYDTIWTPRTAHEKHIATDLQSFLSTNLEDESKSNDDDCRTMILIDQVHLKLMPFLRQRIYNFMFSIESKRIVRVVLILNSLSEEDLQMWSRTCHIFRVPKWSDRSLIDLPELILSEADEKTDDKRSSRLWSKVVQSFRQMIKESKIHQNITNEPRKYLDLLETFSLVKQRRLERLASQKIRLHLGVEKLEEASNEVSKLKKDAEQQQQILNEKRNDADAALNMITSSMHSSEDQKIELEEIKARTEKESVRLKARKGEIELELKEVEPILQQAKSAVGGIKSEALSEIKALRAPPEVIRDILEGVIRLMGVHDTSWGSMKSFLSRRGIKEEIMNFDARRITPNNREKVEILLRNKMSSFEEIQAKRASIAAVPLANWVKANLAFAKIIHKIRPLEEEQNRLEAGLKSAQNRMKTLSSELQGVESEVNVLRDRLNQVTIEAAQIEVNLKHTTDMLKKSENLLTDLTGEFDRWKDRLTEINDSMAILDQQCLIAAFYIHFIGEFSSNELQAKLLSDCCTTLDVQIFDVKSFLEIHDKEAIFYGVSSSHLTPAILDPGRNSSQSIGREDCIDASKPDWNKRLELCMRLGKTVMIENISALNLPIVAIMRREIFGGNGSRCYLTIGDRKVDFHESFKLIIRLSEAQESIVLCPLVRIIDMAPSKDTTTASLLSLTISIRSPGLEEKKKELESNKLAMKIKLDELEDQLLIKLSSSSGNFLNDTELITSLREIKQSAKQVETSLKDLLRIDEDLERERNEYRSLASLGYQLFHYSQELVNLNRMYVFGIREFEEFYQRCLTTNQNLSDEKLLQAVLTYISHSLFPNDRTIFKCFLENHLPSPSRGLQSKSVSPSLKSFLKSCITTPNSRKLIIVINSPGTDPTSEIRDVASESNFADPVFISMGSEVIGQVESLLSSGAKKFICLSNCHLVIDWLPQLRNKIAQLSNDQSKSNEDQMFLVLVTQIHECFPNSLLEMGIKFAYSSSPGLRALVSNFDTRSSENEEKNRLVFFHSVCCERRNYLPIGWTKQYDFGFHDYKITLNALDKIRRQDRKLQLQYIKGILGSVFYGAKLDTQMDLNILRTLTNHWFGMESPINRKEELLDEKNELSVLGLPLNLGRWKVSFLEQQIEKGLKILETATKAKNSNVELAKLIQKVISRGHGRPRTRSTRRPSSHSMGKESPVVTFIQSEIELIGELIAKIQDDMESPSDSLRDALLEDETPEVWQNYWESGPNRASEFIECVLGMERQIEKLFVSTQIEEYDLSLFIRPSSLLSAIRQKASRELNINMDELCSHCQWSDHSHSSSGKSSQLNSVQVKLFGISIEGALFDGSSLQDCNVNSSLQNPIPPLRLHLMAKNSKPPESSIINLPLYGSNRREQLVTYLNVPCSSGLQEYWTMRGAAFVINHVKF